MARLKDFIRQVTGNSPYVTMSQKAATDTFAPKHDPVFKGVVRCEDGLNVRAKGEYPNVEPGTIRYREDSNNSYVEMWMRTGPTSYDWRIIFQDNW